MKEIWKPIKDYEGYYEISNLGNVRGVDRIILNSRNVQHLRKSKIIKLVISNKGYIRVGLRNKSKKMFSVHRLVAIAFIPNPHNKPMVNHKDGNKENNYVSNLEWATQSENEKHAHLTGLKPKPQPNKGKFGKDNKSSKHVIKYDLMLNYLDEYVSIKEAADKNNIDNSDIGKVCNGKRKSCGGFIWKFKTIFILIN